MATPVAAAAAAAATQNPVPLPEIPVKLRCNICSGLARGAVRLPCCEQAICETCRANLPNVCPVCDHSPLNADDCKPNSALRTTVAVFLRTAEKKLALALQKEQKATQQQQQYQNQHQQHLPLQQQHQLQQQQALEPIARPEVKAPEQPAEQAVLAAGEDQPVTPAAKSNTPVLEGDAGSLEEKKQDPTVVAQRDTEDTAQGKTDQPEAKAGPHDVAQQQLGYNQPNGAWFNGQAQDQMAGIAQPMFSGQDMSAWGGYGAQGGVWGDGYGNGMMGYPMMNPMVMAQSGYGGGNFGNMGVGGYNGQSGGGMEWDNGWGGQNNMGYNQGMAGMRNGGYYSAASAAGGYNHQSQGSHQVPSQQYQNPHFQRQQNFPRGGGFTGGVGNRPYNASDSSSQQQQQHQSQQQAYGEGAFQQQIQGIEDVAVAVKKAPSTTDTETKGEKIPSIVSGDLDDIDATTSSAVLTTDAVVPTETESTVVAGLGEGDAAAVGTDSTGISTSIPTAPMNQPDVAAYSTTLHDDYSGQNFQNFHQQPYINGYQGRGGYSRGGFGHVGGRGGFRGNANFGMRGGYGINDAVPNGISIGSDKIPPSGFGKGVEGAPTGPKAMREGKPNRGIIRGGGFGSGRGGYSGGGSSSWVSRSHSPPDHNTDHGRSYSRSVSAENRRRSRSARSRDDSRDRTRRHSRSASRDQDRSRSRRHRSRSRTRRSPTPSKDSDGYQSERGRTPKREEEDTDKVSSPIKTPQSAKLASVPEDSQPPSAAPSGRGKRSREASGSRERDLDQDQEPVASRATSHSRSRSGERRHKRTRRHRRRSTSPEREKEKDRSSRHHRKPHRTHRSSRKHRRSRSRTPRSRSRSPRREVSDTEDRIAEDAGDRRSSRRSSKERRHKRRSRKEEGSHDRDRTRGDRDRGDRDRDRHRSHRSHRSSRHERHERHRDYDRDNNDDTNNDDKTTPVTNSNERQASTIAAEPISPSKTKKTVTGTSSLKPERKLSYKYEDEGDLERRAERDREAERWGIK
ncbi:hypothetical protein BDD12DRAFT_895239 [Trichophaea hybrida]|nr:hypothetical protein BDD12DRAFT_895239 [Trichophaea hybrida]